MRSANRFRASRAGVARSLPPLAVRLDRAGARRRTAVRRPSGGTLQARALGRHGQGLYRPGHARRVDNAPANQLVQNARRNGRPCRRRASAREIAGTLPFDVTGANAGQIIGADNGGGIQVIYDGDGSVIDDFIGVGLRRARHRDAGVSSRAKARRGSSKAG